MTRDVSRVRVRVFVNPGAGSVDDEGELAESITTAFESAGAEALVDVVEPDDVADTVRGWWDAHDRPDVIVVAGGDGSVNCLAAAAAGTDIVISVLPLGTFNHFATDIGLPDDLEGAAAAIVAADVHAVDVAEVNGRVFVNNSALGVYPSMVAVRDRIRDERGWGKVRAVPIACVRVLRQLPIHRLEVSGSDGLDAGRVRTPFVFIGNGRYDNGDGGRPERVGLDNGLVHMAMARTVSRTALIRMAVIALISGSDKAGDLEEADVSELEIGSNARRLLVARDGEVDWMEPPLRYRSRPGDLLVRAPMSGP